MRRLKITLASLALALTLLSLAGCYSTMITNGDVAGVPSPHFTQRSVHHGLFRLANFTGPIWLERVCPGGWAGIYVHTGLIDSLVEMAVSGLYNPQTVTITCVGGAKFNAVRDEHGRVVYVAPAQQQRRP